MEQIMSAKQRALAIAKLKRAASSPRMKDGRRPSMHVEAMSEEESRVEEKTDKRGPKNPRVDRPSEGAGIARPLPDQTLEPRPTDPQPYQPDERAVNEPGGARGSKVIKNKPKVVPSSHLTA